MIFRSLLTRLLWRVSAITFGTAVIVSTILILTFKSRIDDLRDRSLQGQARDIAQHLAIASDDPALQLPEDLARIYAESNGSFVYTVVDEGGRLLFASKGQVTPIKRLERDDVTSQSYFSFRSAELGNTLYGTSIPVSLGGRNFVVQVAQGPKHPDVLLDDVFEEVVSDVGWIVLAFLLLLLSVTYFTVKQSLAPLTKASAEATAIGPAAAHKRLQEGNIPLEVRPLVRAVNSALERLERGLEMQRAFTADAAHELRTPLAVLKAHIDTLADQRAARSLSLDVSRMERIVEQFLRLAQVEGHEIDAMDRADLHAIAVEVATMTAPLAAEENKTVEVVGHQRPLIVAGNADLIGLAVRNLVENGLQHTPPGSGVEISLDPKVGITVIDHGPGIAKEHQEHVFQRFWRGVRNKGSNAGLGLSIVERCVQLCGGDVIIEDSGHGGAVFTIRLPRPLA